MAANMTRTDDHRRPLAERLKECLEERPEVVLAVLFGSHARGREREGSDVDLGVELAPGAPAFETLQELEVSLSRALGRFVDLVDLKKAPPLLRFEIARDGLLLVERRPYAWADFKARAMIDWWDWAPYARRIHAAAVRRLKERASRGSA